VNCEFYINVQKDPAKSNQYLEEQDLASYDRVFIPIREGAHCTLAVIHDDNHLDFYDSLGRSGDEVAKNLSKFFKDYCKQAKKDSRAKKSMSQKKWDHSLKLLQMIDSQIQKRQGDGAIFALYFSVLLVDKKPIGMPADGRSKLAHKLIEMIQYVKTLDTAVLREIGGLADAAPHVESQEMEVVKDKKKRGTFAPGTISPDDVEQEKKKKS